MGPAWKASTFTVRSFTEVIEAIGVRPRRPRTLGGAVQDLLYVGLTIVVFAALWLLVKGVESFER